MKLVFLGIPGSGKSTQGNLLAKKYSIPYLSTGDIFRAIAKENTSIGEFIRDTMVQGHLIPDAKTIEVVHEYLSRPEYAKGYILDGFPRTIEQAQKYTDTIDNVLYLTLSDEVALKRLNSRQDVSRTDDTQNIIKKRLQVFHAQTKPVIEYYQNKDKLLIVDGEKPIEEIHSAILEKLGPKKKIITLVGLPGAGKSEAARFFNTKKIPIIEFGDVERIINERKLENTNEVHRAIRNELRKKYGMKAFAFLNQQKIQSALQHSDTVVIENMRSWEEYEFIKHAFAPADVCIVSIFSPKAIRYERMKNRKKRKHVGGVDRDISELIETNMGPTIAFADYMIENSTTVTNFRQKLESIYKTISKRS